jgi:hypothetical protein
MMLGAALKKHWRLSKKTNRRSTFDAFSLPLNRQSDVYEREGIDLDVSTLADWDGAAAVTLMPLVDVIRDHVFAAERVHADDTTVPFWPRARPASADYGPMFAMIARSPVPIRRLRCGHSLMRLG